MGEKLKRLFIGIPILEDIKKKILPLSEELKVSGAALSLVPPENLHFTIKYLDEVSESKILRIKEVLNQLACSKKPFSVELAEVGVFSSLRNIRVIWIGAENKEFVHLLKETNILLDFVRKNEHQEEIPHLTVARVKSDKNKDKLIKFVEKHQKDHFGKMLIDSLVLYESILTEKGSIYRELKKFNFVDS
ncbi:RNA 2',3'-cyclic phosphodiesterase [Candidatus Woesearchaeota archaeon]|nr:RNA 2',3'-cyclic phosphodiesterase [Candidatus Woesearchaeota archaeon]